MTSEFRSRRFLLCPGQSEQDFNEVAASLRWTMAGIVADGDEADEVRRVVWQADEDARVACERAGDSQDIYVSAAVVSSQERITEIAELIESRFDVVSLDELLAHARAAQDENARARALTRAGAAAPIDFDQRFFDLLKEGASDPSEVVRRSALFATTYPGWQELDSILEESARNDQSEEIRQYANDSLWIRFMTYFPT